MGPEGVVLRTGLVPLKEEEEIPEFPLSHSLSLCLGIFALRKCYMSTRQARKSLTKIRICYYHDPELPSPQNCKQ